MIENKINENEEGFTVKDPVAPIELLAQYVKDLSFETPSAPQIFQDLRENMPDIPVEIECETEEIKENQHEVILRIHSEATIAQKTVFILVCQNHLYCAPLWQDHTEEFLFYQIQTASYSIVLVLWNTTLWRLVLW